MGGQDGDRNKRCQQVPQKKKEALRSESNDCRIRPSRPIWQLFHSFAICDVGGENHLWNWSPHIGRALFPTPRGVTTCNILIPRRTVSTIPRYHKRTMKLDASVVFINDHQQLTQHTNRSHRLTHSGRARRRLTCSTASTAVGTVPRRPISRRCNEV
jgi:hypothetical protein